uniref:Uncharacterized protein n=1 Tax=Glossina palpalis gambiensis TaxID=67801 RepID=A0A1B0BG12_9MUSC
MKDNSIFNSISLQSMFVCYCVDGVVVIKLSDDSANCTISTDDESEALNNDIKFQLSKRLRQNINKETNKAGTVYAPHGKLFGVTLETAVKITRYYTILHDDDGVCTEETIKAQPMAISVTSMNTNLQISKCFVVQLPHDKKNFSNAQHNLNETIIPALTQEKKRNLEDPSTNDLKYSSVCEANE